MIFFYNRYLLAFRDVRTGLSRLTTNDKVQHADKSDRRWQERVPQGIGKVISWDSFSGILIWFHAASLQSLLAKSKTDHADNLHAIANSDTTNIDSIIMTMITGAVANSQRVEEGVHARDSSEQPPPGDVLPGEPKTATAARREYVRGKLVLLESAMGCSLNCCSETWCWCGCWSSSMQKTKMHVRMWCKWWVVQDFILVFREKNRMKQQSDCLTYRGRSRWTWRGSVYT